jgi:nicotinate-nucleotide adenylyltransferase
MWFAGPARRWPAAGRPGALRLGFRLEPGMKVGLYGGSFNPAHEGHAHVAETARRRLGLDHVIWLVSPQNPLKARHETASLEERMEGVRRLAHDRGMIVSDAESRIGSQYTIDTLRALKARFPGVHFVWIMGADSLQNFHHWERWQDIARLVPMAIYARPGATFRATHSPAATALAEARLPEDKAAILADSAPPAWVYLRGVMSAASSTAIRKARAAANI